MQSRRVFLIFLCIFLGFLGVYTWNQRTGSLDSLCAGFGLEVTGGVMRVVSGAENAAETFWDRYVDLQTVRKKNEELEEKVRSLEKSLSSMEEEKAELIRLRRLVRIEYASPWPMIAARVIGWRMGPNSALNTIMVSNGYLTGGAPGTPVTSWNGLVGRVFKAGPTTAVVLLMTDPGARVSVITSEGRVHGILAGGGSGFPLELRFVRQNSPVKVGELLVTSGVDSSYPKGIPVARVTAISTGSASRSGASVLEIQAEPLVDFTRLEEVWLLQRPPDVVTPSNDDVYSRRLPKIDDMLSSDLSPVRTEAPR